MLMEDPWCEYLDILLHMDFWVLLFFFILARSDISELKLKSKVYAMLRFLKSQTQIYLMWYLMKLNSLIRLCLNFKIESIGFFFFFFFFLHQFICLDSKQGIIHVMFSAELIWFLCYEDFFFVFVFVILIGT